MSPVRPKCKHGNYICELCLDTYSDAARRFSDGINAMLTFTQPWELKAKWLAIGLADGSVSSEIFDHRADAVRHYPDHHFYMPIGNFLQGLRYKDAEMILMFNRDARDAGLSVDDGHNADPFPNIFQGDVYADMLRNALRTNK